MTTKAKPLKTFGVRLDEKAVQEAHELGIDTNELFRGALDEEIFKKRRNNKCPTCGQQVGKSGPA